MINKFEGRYRFLSNFYPCEIEHQGIKYPSTEHFYVAMKANDEQLINGKYYTLGDFREMISNVPTAGQVKRIGSLAKLRSDWENQKLRVMNWSVRQKFKDPALKEMLISTGKEDLVEGNNWHDVYWGICSCPKCDGKGQNNLGKILMEIREEIK